MSFSRFACRAFSMGHLSRRMATSSSSNILVRSAVLSVNRPDFGRVPRIPAVPIHARTFAVKSDEDLAQFLSDEIAAEKQNLSQLPSVNGFRAEQDGSELTFTKESGGEKLVISLNVNHTVDSAEADDGTQEAPEMKSKPNFEVDIIKGGKTLSFSCSYIYHADSQEQEAREEGYDDVFAIDEVTLYEGEWSDKKYAVAGDILDGYLYDLFMNMLDERGVNKAFVETLSEYCSSYEQSLYIKMLEDLQQFVKK